MLRFQVNTVVLLLGVLAACGPSQQQNPASSPPLAKQAAALGTVLVPTLKWSGSNASNCMSCRTPNDYKCAAKNAEGDLSFTFPDPVRPGDRVAGITMKLYSRFTAGNGNVDIYLNGHKVSANKIGTYSSNQNVCAATCDAEQTFTLNATVPNDLAIYNHKVLGDANSGQNTLTFDLPGGTTYCISHADITLSVKQPKLVVEVEADPLDFGNQKVSTTSIVRNVRIRNTGELPLEVSGVSIGANQRFTVTPPTAQFDVPAGGNQLLPVRFIPNDEGTVSGTLTINSNDPSTPSKGVALMGTGVLSAADVSRRLIPFGSQRVNVPSTAQTLTVRNASGSSFNFTAATSAPYTVSPTSFTLAQGAAQQLSVTFTPSVENLAEGTLTISSNEQGDVPVEVDLTGTGIKPVVALDKTTLPFGSQRVNVASTSQAVVVSNTGSDTLIVSAVDITGPYTVSPPGAFTLAPTQTRTLNVTFTPTGPGPASGSLLLTTDDTNPSVSLTGNGVRPIVSLNKNALSFNTQRVGNPSAAQTVVVTNNGTDTLNVSAVNMTGPYAVTPNDAFTLAPTGTRTLSVTFTPSTTGPASGSLSLLTDDTNPSVDLTGTGIKPVVSLDKTGLTFGPQRVGTPSASQSVVVTNNGTDTLSVSAVNISGPFTVTPNAAFTLAPTQTTTLLVRFNPAAAGPASGALALTTDDTVAPNPSVNLTGDGVKPTATLSTNTLAFGSQRVGTPSTPPQTVTVTNTGTDSLQVFNVAVGGGEPFTVTPTSFALAPGTNTTLTVTFAPTIAGPLTGTVTLTTDEPDNANPTISLTGTGVKPIITLSTTELNFLEQRVNMTSAPQTVTVGNTGTLPLVVSPLTLSAGAPFTVTPSGGFTLPVGQTRVLSVVFHPTVEESVTASFSLPNDDSDSSNPSVALLGQGVKPTLELTPASVTFTVPQRVATSSPPRTVTVKNSGTGTLHVTSVSLPAGSQFSVPPTAPFTLGPNATRSLSVTFNPTTEGTINDTLTLVTNDPATPSTVPLSGTGVRPNLVVSPAPLAFGNQRVGSPTAARTVTVENTGSGPVAITAIATTSPAFTVTPTAPGNLGPGQSRQLSVAFNPSALGPVSAELRITTDEATPSSAPVALSGTGVAPNLQVTPTTLAFNELRVGNSATQQVTVRNTGTGPIRITGLAITAGQPFTVSPNAAFDLEPNTSQVLDVTFSPSAQSAASAALTVTTNDPGFLSTTINLSGMGVRPTLELTPASVTFTTPQRVGSTSPALTVTVRNMGTTGTLQVTSVSVPAGSQFTVSPTTAFSLAPGASRPLSVTFSPTIQGAITDTLTLVTNDPDTPSTVLLSGTGVRPNLQVSPTALAFGNQPVGNPSAPQTVTVLNNGTGPVAITGISTTSGEYTLSPPVAPFTLAAGQNRVLSVVFTPSSKASFPAELRLTTDETTPSAAPVALSGTGVTVLEMNPATAVNFGNVPRNQTVKRTVKLTNASGADIQISLISQVGAPFAVTGLSTGTLTARSTVTFEVSFTPTSAGPFNTVLSVQSNAVNTPYVLSLDGNGVVPQVQFSNPVPVGSPPGAPIASVDFGGVQVNTTKQLSVRLTNTGQAPLDLQVPAQPGNGFGVSGLNAVTLQPGTFLDFQVSFQPSANVTSSATLTVTSNATNSPTVLSLTGSGAQPEIKVSRNSIFFGDARVGSDSSPVPITVSNTGNTDVTIQNLPVVGAFAVVLPVGEPLPRLIPAKNSFTFNVVFKPSVQGTAKGSVSVISDITNSQPLQVALEGNGTIAVASLSVAILDFASQRVTVTSGVQPVIITNTGAAQLEITEFIFSNSAFAVSAPLPLPTPAAPLRIAAGEQKAVSVTFTPSTLGATEGKLFIISNAFTPAAPLTLKGIGVDGQMSLDPSVVTFAGIEVGGSGAQKIVKITNSGEASLEIKSVAVPTGGAFSVSGLPVGLVLQPGAEWPFTVTFTPVRRGYVSASAVIGSDAKMNPSFSLALEGTGVAAALELQPKIINFGSSNVQVSTTQDISIKNAGERDLYVSNIAFVDTASGGAGAALDFSVVGTAFPLVVKPGESKLVQLRFNPRVIGSRQAKAVVYTNDADPANISEAVLIGNGTSPRLELSSVHLDAGVLKFGNVLVGTPSTARLLKVTNRGTGPLTLTSVALGGADAASFILTPPSLPLTLQPEASTEVTVALRPDAERLFSAQLVMGSNDAEALSVAVPLSGAGVRQQIQLSEASLEFGQILVNNRSSLRKVRVANNSDTNVTLSALSVEGTGASQYSLANLPLPLVLRPGQEQEVGLYFTPQSETDVNCTLKITFSDLLLPLEVSLHGKGIPAVLSIRPSPLDFGGVRAGGARRELPLTITNLSSEPIVLSSPESTYNTGERFSYELSALRGRTLEPGTPLIVMVGYQPMVETLSEETLEFGTTTPNDPRAVRVYLKGKATKRLLTVDFESLDFGRVDVGEPVEPKTITITNRSAQQQRVVVKLRDEGTPYTLDTRSLIDAVQAGATATFTVSFDPQKAGQTDNEVQVALQSETEAEALIPVTGNGRALMGQGGGCSTTHLQVGSTSLLALLALMGLGSRRRRRE